MKTTQNILLAFLLVFVAVSCRSTKSTMTSKIKQKEAVVIEEKKDLNVVKTLEKVTAIYGDTLKGAIPIPELTDKPLILNVESSGTKLQLVLTKNSIKYKSASKKIATTSSKETTEIKDQGTVNTSSKKELDVEIKTKTKKTWKPPWFFYLIIVFALLALYRKFKSNIKLF